MKSFRTLLRFFACCFSLGIFAGEMSAAPQPLPVKELARFSELLAKHTPGTLYVLDLDNTVMRPSDFFGSDPFFNELVKLAADRGVSYPQWRSIINATVAAIAEHDIQMIFADAEFRTFFDAIGPQSFIGLTARAKDFQRGTTAKHFLDLGLQFQPELFLPNLDEPQIDGTVFAPESGVLLVGSNNKGHIVKELVRRGKNLTRIVFVDDLPKHAGHVAEACAGLDVPVEVYRFTQSDTYIANYATQYAGQWDFVTDFLKKYVFGKYQDRLTAYPQELALMQAIVDATPKCESAATPLVSPPKPEGL